MILNWVIAIVLALVYAMIQEELQRKEAHLAVFVMNLFVLYCIAFVINGWLG